MPATPPREDLTHDAVAASVHVVESAVELARAEARLLVARAQRTVVRALTVALGVIVAISFVELTLVLVALSPLFVSGRMLPLAPYPFVISLGLTSGVAASGAAVAWTAWRHIRSGNDA